jgi:hypothetical protein
MVEMLCGNEWGTVMVASEGMQGRQGYVVTVLNISFCMMVS